MKSKALRIIAIAAIALITASATGFCDEAPAPESKGEAKAEPTEKQKDIRRLFAITGSGKIGIQLMNQMIDSYERAMPQVPKTFWDDFKKEADAEDLAELCVPIYDKLLSHDDIKNLIKFYETPSGQHFIKALPLISQESMKAGESWGREIGRKAIERLKENGYIQGQ